jgi:hypothetical protein
MKNLKEKAQEALEVYYTEFISNRESKGPSGETYNYYQHYEISLRNWEDRLHIMVITSKDEEGTSIPVFGTQEEKLENIIGGPISILQETIENFERVKKGEMKMILRDVCQINTITISKDNTESLYSISSPIEFVEIESE